MGKKIRNYRIFVLFLLISISVFSKNTKIPPGQAKKNQIKTNEQADESNGNKAWIEKVEFLDGNQVKINLITRTQKDIDSLTIEEIEGWRTITLGKNERKDISKNGDNKYIYIWSIIYDIKSSDTTTISFKIKKNWPKDGTNSIGEKEISCNISDKDIEIKTYEEIYQVEKSKIKKDGYIFTKGGRGSNNVNPAIYVTIPARDSDEEKIKELKIETLNLSGNVIETETIKLEEAGNIEIESNYFNYTENGTYRVRITPISKDKNRRDIEGESKILNFIVDTKVNSSYLDDEDIISELEAKNGKPIIKIKLSKFKELSGINKYSYTLSNGLQRENKEGSVDGGKYLTPTKDGKLKNIEIPLGDFSEGSRLTLSFTVYDRLGHKKTYEKTYFIPKQSDGIIAKVSGEVKQRRSKIKIVTEGNKDKFRIESSIDGSSEDETTINES